MVQLYKLGVVMTKENHEDLTEEEFFTLVEKTFPQKFVNSIQIKHHSPKIKNPHTKNLVSMDLFTDINHYMISIRPEDHLVTSDQKTYLGCIVQSRKERAGETWKRGRDLADGPCTNDTWQRILKDIVNYELVKIHKPEDAFNKSEIKVGDLKISSDGDLNIEGSGFIGTATEEAMKNSRKVFLMDCPTLNKKEVKKVIKKVFQDKQRDFEIEQANQAGKELYKYLGSPAGGVTVAIMYKDDGNLQLVVYLFKDFVPFHLTKKPTKFYGYDVIYQEMGMPIAQDA